MNAVTTTKRKKCVAPRRAGEAVAMQMIPKIWKSGENKKFLEMGNRLNEGTHFGKTKT